MTEEQPKGRARGRARGRPKTAEELAAMQRPGEASSAPSKPAGRGRGDSYEREAGKVPRGRGVSQERSAFATGPPAGRAHHRGAATDVPGLVTQLSTTGLAYSSSSSGGLDADGAAPSAGRGAVRGRREREGTCLRRTRPEAMVSKQGEGGTDLPVTSNYFELIAKPNWRLLQYRVDMKPEVDHTGVRKALLYAHKEKLPKFIFDGTMIFAIKRFTDDDRPLVLLSRRESDRAEVEIKIRLVGEVQPTDYHFLQFFNIVLRQAMENMKLELIGRDYFDPQAAILLKQYKLELWPGYVTSIRQHEEKVLMCCEISHKVLRTDTVLDQMGEVFQKTKGGPGFRADVEKALLGAIIITRYNNKTYRIDEIAWDKKPTDEFEGKDGEKLSYMKYYETRYNTKINDLKQPLLISMPKVREQRSGVSGPIYLIPELCNMTGLSDEQRANFSLMKAMGEYTRQDPEKRTTTLLKFAQRLNGTKAIADDLRSWHLKYSDDLAQFRARVLRQESILGGGSSKATYKEEDADWSRAFRKWNCFSATECTDWAVVYTTRDEAAVKEFVREMKKNAPSLGLALAAPSHVVLGDSRPVTYVQRLHMVLDAKPKPQIVMVVIPNDKQLTYKLTHLYYNWPGTVRVPAPCQYAHKLAFLVGESLHMEPSVELQDTLYYL